MKLHRWLVTGMWGLCVISVVAAIGWWWATWPERTARAFFQLVAAGRVEEAEQLLSEDVALMEHVEPVLLDGGLGGSPIVTPTGRDFSDFCRGRADFKVA